MPIIEKQSALRTKSSDSHLYKIIVVDGNDCKRIFEDFGHTDGQITLRVNRANLSSEELSQAFLRGVFLSCGSVSDPMKSYHLEFCVPHKNLSQDLCKILSEITECTLIPKTVVRSGSYIVYFKESEQICDLLTYIGSPIRSMEIIDELEPTQRNVYTGSIGYIGFNGDMDLNIAIRTIVKKEDEVYFQVGGGMTWGSNPEEEYQETLDKAQSIMKALRGYYEE